MKKLRKIFITITLFSLAQPRTITASWTDWFSTIKEKVSQNKTMAAIFAAAAASPFLIGLYKKMTPKKPIDVEKDPLTFVENISEDRLKQLEAAAKGKLMIYGSPESIKQIPTDAIKFEQYLERNGLTAIHIFSEQPQVIDENFCLTIKKQLLTNEEMIRIVRDQSKGMFTIMDMDQSESTQHLYNIVKSGICIIDIKEVNDLVNDARKILLALLEENPEYSNEQSKFEKIKEMPDDSEKSLSFIFEYARVYKLIKEKKLNHIRQRFIQLNVRSKDFVPNPSSKKSRKEQEEIVKNKLKLNIDSNAKGLLVVVGQKLDVYGEKIDGNDKGGASGDLEGKATQQMHQLQAVLPAELYHFEGEKTPIAYISQQGILPDRYLQTKGKKE